ncbi:MAG: AmmeMemoRadiSam system radical SAM enzyme [Endomicrobiales bacterium]|jgi:pyruvate formate lyase activating enzyme
MKYIVALLLFVYSFPCTLSAKEAQYYETTLSGDVQCLLCPRACLLKEGETGVCRVRRNVNGKMVSLTYGQVVAANVDPIEKKPLFQFLPASETFSIAAAGCNLRCAFCQNWNISQAEPGTISSVTMMPDDVVTAARTRKCQSISFTYSEPTVFYEYMFDTAARAKKQGIKNVLVSCGYINPGPLKNLCSVIDAANVDLKGFSDRAYKQIGAARLAPVLETLTVLKHNGVWVEVGYLVIPTLNDDPAELKKFVEWVATNLGHDVPVHFLRFFPQHRLTHIPPTPLKTLEQAYALAKEQGINYVYIGNVPGHRYENTWCPHCGKLLIERKGYFVENDHIIDGKCMYCGYKIAGVWH